MTGSIGRYTILDRIGAGVLGELFRARDTRFGRTVALRVVAPAIAADHGLRARLLERARVAGSLSHANIAALFEHGEDAGRVYLAGEFVAGRTLHAEIAGVPLHWRRACAIAAQVGDALAEIHAASVAHGGLTTASVIVTPKETAKLLDAGFGAWPRAADDERDDIVSFGRLLAEMLLGRPPGDAAGPAMAAGPVEPILRRAVGAATAAEPPAAAVLAAELRAVAGG
jgi:serine/threonine-protein kinase